MTSTHPALDDLRSTLLEVKEALEQVTEAITEGLRLLDRHGGDSGDT